MTDPDPTHRAFAALVAPHLDALYRAAYRLVGNRPDAQDLVQEVCLKAYPKLAELQRLDSPKAWLLKVQYRLFVDGLRRRVRSPISHHADSADDDTDPGTHDLPDTLAAERRLEQAWQRLSRDQRALLALHAEGYTLAEMQAITDLQTDAIKVRLYRARIRLGKLLDPQSTERREPHAAGELR